MKWYQKLVLKGAGINLNDVFPQHKEKGSRTGSGPFTTNVFDSYNLTHDPLARKDYIAEYKNWAYACINARAESIGNIKLRLKDKKTGEEVEGTHDILELLYHPNTSETMYDLFAATQSFKDLDGNAFWFLARSEKDGKGKIQGLYNLRPDKMRIVLDKENPLEIKGYVYSNGTENIPFKPEEIMHQRTFNPNAPHPLPHRGMGIIQAAAYAIDTDNESRKWNLAFFRNSARPDGILYNDGDGTMRPEDFKRTVEEFEDRHRGSDNAMKLSILSGGMKYEPVTSTHTEMDFYQQRLFGRDEILAMFKVPKTVIGVSDDVNRANADAAIYVYNLLTVKPLMQRLVDHINMYLLPLVDPSNKYELDFHSPISEDRAQLLDEYQIGCDIWLTKNEIREREGLPLIEGGDKLYVSMINQDVSSSPDDEDEDAPPAQKRIALRAVDSRLKKVEKKTVVKEEKTKKVPASKAEEIVEKFIAKLPKSEKAVKLEKDVKDKYVADYMTNSLAEENRLKKGLTKYFNAQEKEVIKNLQEEMKGLDSKEFYLKKGIEDAVFDVNEAIETGISFITPYIKTYIKKAGITATDLAGGTEFNSDSKFLKNWIENRAKFFSTSVNDTTSENLSQAIQAGITGGESIDQISGRVAGVFDKAKGYRSDMIARTEVHAAANVGSVEAYKQAGIKQHEWVVVAPEDKDCIVNDGEIRDIGEAFPSGAVNPEDEHPNCQCTTVPVFDDEKKEE